MDLIKQRDKRTIRRKIAKSKFDNMITLSADAPKGIRLLDEGAVVNSEGGMWFYVEKGALQRYLDSLDDDFVGYIKPFHIDFENFGLLLGEYKKSDMTLVDIGEGRKSLHVNPTWYKTHLLEDLKAMPYDLSVSVEMDCWADEEATESFEFPVYKDLFVHGFAVVGDGGNVNSNGVRLNSGGEKVALDFKSINEALENQSQLDLSALQEALNKMEATEAKVEEEETAEEPVEASVEEEEGEETVETVEADAEPSTDDVLAKVEELTAKVEELTEENKTLSEKIETLEADKTALTEKLSAKAEEEKKFVEKFKALTVHVSDPKPETKSESIVMDGIGEL